MSEAWIVRDGARQAWMTGPRAWSRFQGWAKRLTLKDAQEWAAAGPDREITQVK